MSKDVYMGMPGPDCPCPDCRKQYHPADQVQRSPVSDPGLLALQKLATDNLAMQSGIPLNWMQRRATPEDVERARIRDAQKLAQRQLADSAAMQTGIPISDPGLRAMQKLAEAGQRAREAAYVANYGITGADFKAMFTLAASGKSSDFLTTDFAQVEAQLVADFARAEARRTLWNSRIPKPDLQDEFNPGVMDGWMYMPDSNAPRFKMVKETRDGKPWIRMERVEVNNGGQETANGSQYNKGGRYMQAQVSKLIGRFETVQGEVEAKRDALPQGQLDLAIADAVTRFKARQAGENESKEPKVGVVTLKGSRLAALKATLETLKVQMDDAVIEIDEGTFASMIDIASYFGTQFITLC